MNSIGALVAILSLNLTSSLIQNYGVVAATLPITGATPTTPITISSPAHGCAPGRVLHGLVSGVTGTTEANGMWVATPVDPNTFALATYSPQGIPTPSVGVNAYTGGGQLQTAFPDGGILLGRRNVALASSVATPRIVFVPCAGKGWSFDPYGGAGAPAVLPNVRGSLEQQAAKLQPQIATEFLTFEVHVSAAASPPSPDFGDFDATQFIVFAMYATMFNTIGPRAVVLKETWPSQFKDAGTQSQRGQAWLGMIEFSMPITQTPLQFVPVGTSIEMTVEPVDPFTGDPITFEINPL